MSIKNYRGITHFVPLFVLPLWKKCFCKKGWHLFDEVATCNSNYLSCDACEIVVNIKTEDCAQAE